MALARHRRDDGRVIGGEQGPREVGAEHVVAVHLDEVAVHLVARHPAAGEVVRHGVEGIVNGAHGYLVAPRDAGQRLFHEVGAETGDDDEFLHAAGGEGVDLAADERLAVDVQQGLGQVLRQRQQAAALTGGEDDDLHLRAPAAVDGKAWPEH